MSDQNIVVPWLYWSLCLPFVFSNTIICCVSGWLVRERWRFWPVLVMSMWSLWVQLTIYSRHWAFRFGSWYKITWALNFVVCFATLFGHFVADLNAALLVLFCVQVWRIYIVIARGQNLVVKPVSSWQVLFYIMYELQQPRSLLDHVFEAALSQPGLPGLTMH